MRGRAPGERDGGREIRVETLADRRRDQTAETTSRPPASGGPWAVLCLAESRAYLVRVCGPDVSPAAVDRALAEVGGLIGDGAGSPGPEAVETIRRTLRDAALDQVVRSDHRTIARLRRLSSPHVRCGRVPGLLRKRATGGLSAAELRYLYGRLDRCPQCAGLTGRLDAAEWTLRQALGRTARPGGTPAPASGTARAAGVPAPPARAPTASAAPKPTGPPAAKPTRAPATASTAPKPTGPPAAAPAPKPAPAGPGANPAPKPDPPPATQPTGAEAPPGTAPRPTGPSPSAPAPQKAPVEAAASAAPKPAPPPASTPAPAKAPVEAPASAAPKPASPPVPARPLRRPPSPAPETVGPEPDSGDAPATDGPAAPEAVPAGADPASEAPRSAASGPKPARPEPTATPAPEKHHPSPDATPDQQPASRRRRRTAPPVPAARNDPTPVAGGARPEKVRPDQPARRRRRRPLAVVGVLLLIYVGVVAYVAVPLVTDGTGHKPASRSIAPISRHPLASVPVLPTTSTPPAAGATGPQDINSVPGNLLIVGAAPPDQLVQPASTSTAPGVTSDTGLADVSVLGGPVAGQSVGG
jgi:hypothetical protein